MKLNMLSKERFALLLLGFWTGTTHAAHPLITEDTGTQGKGNKQFELNANRFEGRDRWETVWNATFSYGVHDQADLQIGIPYVAGEGKSDLAIDLKWRFWQRNDLSLGVKPGVTLPTGDEQRDLGTGRVTWGAPFFVSYEPEGWALHGQAAYRRSENTLGLRKDLWQFSASFWLKPTEALKLVSDGAWSTDPRPGDTSWIRTLILGAIWSPRKDIDLDVGMRWDKAAAGDGDRGYLAGVTFRW